MVATGFGPYVSLLAVPPGPAQTPVAVFGDCFIAGLKYHATPLVLGALSIGQTLDLLAETDNPHDRRAVAVESSGGRLGYVPRARNKRLWKMLRKGVPIKAVVAAIDATAPSHRAVRVLFVLDTPTPAGRWMN